MVTSELTPPGTPTTALACRTSIEEERQPATSKRRPRIESTEILAFDGSIDLEDEIGRGAWSKVIAASDSRAQSATSLSDPLSPPASPETLPHAPRALVFKVPSHSLALPVLQQEARILSYLSKSSQAKDYVVDFYGFDSSSNALVLSRALETLGVFAKSSLRARQSLPKVGTKTNSSDPVIGLKPWLRIALQLARGLAWIHSMGIIHGDIKASNVLLTGTTSPSEPLSCKAVFCDFSSARFFGPDEEVVMLPTDAITTFYASPELLRSYSRSFTNANDPSLQPVATEASDIWALAVTLVSAAVGEDPYAHAGHDMRKLAMAKEGMVLDAARMGDWTNEMRLRRGGIVERSVRGALAKRVEARLGIQAWVEVLEGLAKEVGVED